MVGTEWEGLLIYPIHSGEIQNYNDFQFPMILTVTKKKKRVVEGRIFFKLLFTSRNH